MKIIKFQCKGKEMSMEYEDSFPLEEVHNQVFEAIRSEYLNEDFVKDMQSFEDRITK
jgi:hypothetical protein